MGYYVIGEQGQKYGPADVNTLNQWIAEGRIVSHSMLEDETSGGQIVASSVRGLKFSAAPPPVASGAQPYRQAPQYQVPAYQQSGSGDNGPIILAFALAVVSPVLSLLLPFGGLMTALWGIRTAAKAKERGHPLGILAIVACGIAIAFWLFTRATGFGVGTSLR